MSHTPAPIMTPAAIAARFGCTQDQARAHLCRMSGQMRAIADKAAATGRRINGYTAADASERAAALAKAAA